MPRFALLPLTALTCILVFTCGAAGAAAQDLVLIKFSESTRLANADLPVLWKGASFLLADWDEATQAVARDAGVRFEILARRFDADRELYIVELADEDAAIPEDTRVRVLHRVGRKRIVAVDAGHVPSWPARGLSSLRVPRRARGWIPRAPAVAYDCSYDPLVGDLIQRTELAGWTDWIEKLSGAEPLTVAGTEYTVLTRHSPELFENDPTAKAYDYALEQLQGWHFAGNLVEHSYNGEGGATWKNLVATIPGTTFPDEVVLLTAHLDSISFFNPALAPGANDNGTGVATLLEAARILRQLRFQRTIHIVLFTGEEQHTLGSEAFVDDYPVENFLGVVNLDMFGWDGDGDRCFEIHAGTLPDSLDVGTCFADSIVSYGLGLSRDYLTVTATDRSDHASFWQVGVGAIEISENFFDDGLPDGCVGQDANPGYHTEDDTVVANMMPAFGFDIARTGLATIAAMALPVDRCFDESPVLSLTPGDGQIELGWEPLAGAASYRVQRSTEGCTGQWVEIGETSASGWTDAEADQSIPYYYRVEAVDAFGFCVSAPSACVSATPTVYHATGVSAEWIDLCASGGPGSGDGTIDPGEHVLMPVWLLNDGNAPIGDVTGTLSVFHPKIGVIDPYGAWPDLPAGDSASTEPNHFGIRVSPNIACGINATASIVVFHDQGSNPTSISIPVGPGCTPCAATLGSPGEPESTSLMLSRQAGQIVFEWSPPEASCQVADYAVYRGDLGQLTGGGYAHDTALSCATAGTSFAIAESDQSLGPSDYFLVVADNDFQEGSYGRDSAGMERPASASACHAAQNFVACGP